MILKFIQSLGGRKFATMIISLVIFTASSAYLIIGDTTEKASTIVAVATGLTMISGAYFAGNVVQKNNEIK